MMKQLKQTVGKKLGLWTPARSTVAIFPDDTFLVSYPKSGNTWLRFLIGQAMAAKVLDFTTIESVVPDIYQNSVHELSKICKPRILKSHEMYTKEYPKVIYLVRDPRDVAISFYYWRKKTGSIQKLGNDVSLKEYLQHGFNEKELLFHGWGEHVGSWMENTPTATSNFYLLQYEEIEQDPEKFLRQIINFLGWQTDESAIQFAVKHSSASQMREVEKVKLDILLPQPLLSLFGKEKAPFVRRGSSGQWKEVFDDKLNDIYWQRFGKWMDFFGYSKS